MEDTARADDSTLSSVCHDLRQYVAAGLVLSQVADAGEPQNDAPVRLSTIHTLFDQIGLLVNAIGETRPLRTEVHLHEIIDECVQIARATLGLEIEAQIAPTATAFGDPVLLRRAMTNVLDNADECVIEVTDDGLGFGQTSHGSGQGMSVVASAVFACHGRLELVCGPARGTTIRMVLPSSRVAS
jgi:K+-sensing histidine kinase KdpD